MNVETFAPTLILKPFVKAFVIVESETEITNRIIPNTSFALAFRLRGQISSVSGDEKTILSPSTFTGLKSSVRFINYAPRSGAIIVLFEEMGASAFLRLPIHELFEQSVSLDNFHSSSDISEVEDRIQNSNSNAAAIAALEQFLISKITHFPPDDLVSESITKIYSAKGNLRIKELATSLSISQDAFEKRFRKITGATPKQFSHIVKMNSIIRHNSIDTSLLDIAIENGYYDQPHFNRSFKIFTGQTPTDFFKSGSFW